MITRFVRPPISYAFFPPADIYGTLGIRRSDKTLAKAQQMADALNSNEFVKRSGKTGRDFVAEAQGIDLAGGVDDATIAAHLADLSVPTLMCSMVHMAGDLSVLDGLPRPAGIYLNEVQGFMPPEDQAVVRARALEVIRAYRDGGSVAPPAPTPATVHALMELLVAGEVPDEYVPLLLEELGIDGSGPRAGAWPETVGPAVRAEQHVVVIGAGMSGLLAAIRLEEAGIPFTVVEKNPDVGGTWFDDVVHPRGSRRYGYTEGECPNGERAARTVLAVDNAGADAQAVTHPDLARSQLTRPVRSRPGRRCRWGSGCGCRRPCRQCRAAEGG